jgi:biofilm PGA synthesis N-glycosyltransferase PgaC
MAWLLLIIFMPYVFLLLKIYVPLSKIKAYKQKTVSEVFLSVIVACRNEEKNLPFLLTDIACQDYNPDWYELIIVDDNSDDSTFKIANEFRGIKNIKVLKNSTSGKKLAINEGIKISSGDLIVTTDADCRMNHNWLKTVSSYWKEYKPQMIIGPVEFAGGRGFLQRFQELEFLSLQGVTAGSAAKGNPVMCNGANMAFTRESYRHHSEDLHPERVSGDDIFLLHSIKGKKENKIMWLESQDAIVSTAVSETWRLFLKQRARWISKAGSYKDRDTVVLAIVTFVTILLQVILLVAGILSPFFLFIFLAGFVIKSIPDFLVLHNRTVNYKRKNLLWFFLPGQLIYPFYVLSVVICYLFTRSKYIKLSNQ